MAFGQAAGPPATHQQMRQLTELLERAGHTDFRDARGPLGLTQRQAGGKFTRDEADELIARLEAEIEGAAADEPPDGPPAEAPAEAPPKIVPRRASGRPSSRSSARTSGTARGAQGGDAARAARALPSDVLAAELQRRGWVVMEP